MVLGDDYPTRRPRTADTPVRYAVKVHLSLILFFGIMPPTSAVADQQGNLDNEELSWQVPRQNDGSVIMQVTGFGQPPITNLHAFGDGNISIR